MLFSKIINTIFIILLTSQICFLWAQKKSKVIVTGKKMEMLKGGDLFIFTGKAKAVQGKNILKADKLVQNKKNDIIVPIIAGPKPKSGKNFIGRLNASIISQIAATISFQSTIRSP